VTVNEFAWAPGGDTKKGNGVKIGMADGTELTVTAVAIELALSTKPSTSPVTVPEIFPETLVMEKSKLSAWPDVGASANAHANTPKVILFMIRYSVVTLRKKVYQVCISEIDTARARCPEPSGDFLTPSPPGEKKTTARQDQAGQTCACDGTGNLAKSVCDAKRVGPHTITSADDLASRLYMQRTYRVEENGG
jgi:hypothetical protein